MVVILKYLDRLFAYLSILDIDSHFNLHCLNPTILLQFLQKLSLNVLLKIQKGPATEN